MDSLLDHFDLGILPPAEPTLGGEEKDGAKRKARRRARARKRLWFTLLMYFGVFLVVLGEAVMSLFKSGKPFDWEIFGPGRFLLALVIATVIFPQVFPKVFGKMEEETVGSKGDLGVDKRVVQFCIAFQNGFFWQALLKSVSQVFTVSTGS